jgi:hypothetical protein
MTTHSGTVTRAWTTTPPPPGRRCLPVCAVAERAVGGAALAANDEARQRRDELRSLLGPALARDVADPVAKRQQLVVRHVLECRRPVVVVVALLVSDVLRDLPHLLQRGHVRAHSLRQLLAHESCSNRCDAIHGSIVATSTVKRSPCPPCGRRQYTPKSSSSASACPSCANLSAASIVACCSCW